jgi:hypothetical protein
MVPFVYAQYLQITLQAWVSVFATLAVASTPVYRQHYKPKHMPRLYNTEQIQYCLKEFRNDWETLGVEGIVGDLR